MPSRRGTRSSFIVRSSAEQRQFCRFGLRRALADHSETQIVCRRIARCACIDRHARSPFGPGQSRLRNVLRRNGARRRRARRLLLPCLFKRLFASRAGAYNVRAVQIFFKPFVDKGRHDLRARRRGSILESSTLGIGDAACRTYRSFCMIAEYGHDDNGLERQLRRTAPSRRELILGGSGLALTQLAFVKDAGGIDSSADAQKRRLLAAYPQWLADTTDAGIVWRDGTVFPWNDGRADKTFDERLANASLADQMLLPYRVGPISIPPAFNDDPGRFRNIAFFKKMYGSDEASVRANLRPVPWQIGRYSAALPFTRINNVDRIAANIVDELSELPDRFVRYLVPPAGSFDWRTIAATSELSAHAFGIAVDINVANSDYWRWSKGADWTNRIPFEIVDIFERHGFIWGGKWYHYDSMHFEYRPELIARTVKNRN